MEKLKTCPFCGSEARVRQQIIVKGAVAINCTNGKCGADVFFYGTETNRKEVVRRWNRRAERSEE